MKNILIIGAGGFGREVYYWITDMIGADSEWIVKGFLDDNLNALNGIDFPIEILSSIENYKIATNDYFVCAIGKPQIKEIIVNKIIARSGQFFKVIHPTAIITKGALIGEGVIIAPMVFVSTQSEVKDFVSINVKSSIGHDVSIGKYSQISSHCDITGGVKIGESVFIGSSASILPRIKIENFAQIGAGSIVIRKVKESTIVFGNPAKVI